MRVYRRLEQDKFLVLYGADVPDNAMYLEVGSTHNNAGEDGDYPPVAAIDWSERVFQRQGGEWEPFPECYYRERDIEWRVLEDAKTTLSRMRVRRESRP